MRVRSSEQAGSKERGVPSPPASLVPQPSHSLRGHCRAATAPALPCPWSLPGPSVCSGPWWPPRAVHPFFPVPGCGGLGNAWPCHQLAPGGSGAPAHGHPCPIVLRAFATVTASSNSLCLSYQCLLTREIDLGKETPQYTERDSKTCHAVLTSPLTSPQSSLSWDLNTTGLSLLSGSCSQETDTRRTASVPTKYTPASGRTACLRFPLIERTMPPPASHTAPRSPKPRAEPRRARIKVFHPRDL